MSDAVRYLVEHWGTVLLGVIAVAGSIASIISWQAARRSRRVYDRIFRAALDLIEKEHLREQAEKELVATKQRAGHYESMIQKYSQRVIQLQEEIQRAIPIEAKRAVLKDKLENSTVLMKAYYDDVLGIERELKALGEQPSLSDELLRTVRAQIQPKYLLRERISHLKTLLTAATASAAIASAVLPYPFSRWIGFLLLMLSLPIVLFLVRALLGLKPRRVRRR